MAFNLPTPPSLAKLMQEDLERRIRLLAQPVPEEQYLVPGIATANQGFEGLLEQKRRNELIAKAATGTSNPEAAKALLGIGIEPAELKSPPLSQEASNAVRGQLGGPRISQHDAQAMIGSQRVNNPGRYQAKEYIDEQGKARIGRFNPDTGQLETNTTDALAPAGISLSEHSQQFNQKRLVNLGDALDPSKQRQGAFAISKQVFDRAERLESLAAAFPDGNLRRQEIEEIAIGLNAMLSGANTGAQEQIKSLMPNTIVGNSAKIAEWLTNDPTGAQQQEIVKRMLGSVAREKATAAAQIRRTQLQRIARYANLENSNPDEFYNVLQSAGIEPEEYKTWKKGGFHALSAVQSPAGPGTAPVPAPAPIPGPSPVVPPIAPPAGPIPVPKARLGQNKAKQFQLKGGRTLQLE